MNPFERQMQVNREMMELNSEWFRKFAEFDSKNFNAYVQLNQDFAGKLPEVKDVQGFLDLQREYGEQLWNGAQNVMKARGEMMQEAFQATGKTLRGAFVSEEVSQPEPAAKSTAKKAAA